MDDVHGYSSDTYLLYLFPLTGGGGGYTGISVHLSVCPCVQTLEDVLRITQPFITKLDMAVHHYESECKNMTVLYSLSQ